jgi:TonB family protein
MKLMLLVAFAAVLVSCAAPQMEIQHASVQPFRYELTGQELAFDAHMQIIFRGLPDVPSRRDIDGKVLTPPYLLGGKATYPILARMFNKEGRFAVAVLLDANGKPVAVRVIDSSNEQMSQTAIDQAMKLRWSPALVDGAPTRFITILKSEFQLR